MKSSYTFKATPKDTDYQRICRENHQARFLIVKSDDAPPVTFVPVYSRAYYEILCKTGVSPVGRIKIPPAQLSEKSPGHPGQTWLIYEGDLSKELEPKVRTTVEVY